MSDLLVSVNGFRLTPLACLVEGQPTYEAWATMLAQAEHAHRCLGWWLGDLLNYGEAAYGERYAQAVQTTGLAVQTLTNYKSVAKAIPPEKRIEGLSWTAHRIAAFLPPSQKSAVLEWAKEETAGGAPPTSQEMGKAVVELQEIGDKGQGPPSSDPLPPAWVQVLLTRAECQALLDGFGEGWESGRQRIEDALLQF
jgi:hypothetical protein